jgi:electron transfer flavoprotein alpha subunit
MLPGEVKAEQGKSTRSPAVTAMPLPSLDGLHMSVRQLIEPGAGDVDISKEALLVSVGRGIQQKDNIEVAEELAEVLGAVVTGSRPIVDQGWLPTSRLVGKSGKVVRPKLYFALGISGAPEHVEAITGSDMIIAVNTDPAAPIFNLAKYGAIVDILDLLPVLTEQVRQAKGQQ